MAQQGFGPPSLPVGTEVSAKYRGAFCEAKVKHVVRIVKCKVVVKDGQTSLFINDDEIKGSIKLGAVVEVKHPDTGQLVEATINKLIDNSTYTVVFDDGDERTLRRTQLCLKGDKHFIESETLDNLPLSHPEHFGTPVLQNKKAKRKQDDESEEEIATSEEESPRRATYRGRHQELVGKLMLVDLPQRKGSVIPALVVLPDANTQNEVKNRDQILVRSFKDSKFMVVTRKDLKDFTRAAVIKIEDKSMRTAIEKALLYFDTKELPIGWNREELLGSDLDEDEGEEDNEYASEDEPFEEKDRFVAQLYKFMDDRGTPINKGPCIGNKDLNLYKLFKIVQNLGGYNKVTKEMKWAVVYSKMGLPSLHQNPAHQIKTAYKKYLDAYETFYRKLGSTMGTLSRPGRSRQNSSRSILNFRDRERSPRSPKPPEKPKEDAEAAKRKAEASPTPDNKVEEESEPSMVDDSDVATRRTPRRDPKTQTTKEETKEKKEEAVKVKKEETVKAKKEDKKALLNQNAKAKEDKGKESNKKEDKKSAKKAKVDDEGEKEEKKPDKLAKKDDDKKTDIKVEITPSTSVEKESPKKRVTRRKLLTNDANIETEPKEEEDKKDALKKAPLKTAEKLNEKKEIPKTLERRDKVSDKKEPVAKKEIKIGDKKPKSEEKKIKKMKEELAEEPTEMIKSVPLAPESEEKVDTESEKVAPDTKVDFPIGSKLRVKYGKGKNQKIYIAKVVDYGKDGVHKTYLVHYAGWNTRYDEWIRPDRVVSVLDRPSDGDSKIKILQSKPPRLSPPLSGVKIPNLKSASQVFRTPKMARAKTRATRSSSSDTSVVSKASDKMLTRRRSVMADSTGSVSPESQNSSDMEDNTGSERAEDDYETTKSEKEEDEEEDDILNVDEDLEDETEREKMTDPDTSLEDVESALKTGSFDTGSERLENEEMDEDISKDTPHSESFEDLPPELTIDEDEHSDKSDTHLSQETPKKLCELKVEKTCVIVSEIKNVVDEIKFIDCQEVMTLEVEDTADTKDVLENSIEINQNESIDFKFIEESKAEEATESVNESASVENNLSEKKAPQLVKEEPPNPNTDTLPEADKKDKEVEKPRAGRGRKKDSSAKDSKKATKTDIPSPVVEDSNVEQQAPPVESLTTKSDVSPYDFDGEADSVPCLPEMVKKWEPNSKIQQNKDSKDPSSSEGIEKDKKKVKKKVKRKLASEPEVPSKPCDTGDTPNNTATAGIKDEGQVSSNSGDSSSDKPTKKKGRKKKEAEAKKETVDQYEISVNSVVEAVKHSLVETECEPEPAVKRRRLKRVSESDKKDSVPGVSKMGRKVKSKDCLEASSSLENEETKRDSMVSSQLDTSQPLPFSELVGSSTSTSADAVGTSGQKSSKRKDAIYPETQEFEPNLEQESGAAPFDNTPPTTPEHDEENNSSGQYNTNDLDSSAKPVCSTLSPCITPGSSTLTKCVTESPSDNDLISSASTENLDHLAGQPPQSESSGTDQDVPVKKRKLAEEASNGPGISKKKKRIHGTRSRTAQKSPKYVGNSDSQGSASNTPNHCPDSPLTKFPDISKSPRPSKFNFSADLGEYLEGEARCNFLIGKMREIKSIYMNLKAEVASIDRRRKRAKRKERESSHVIPGEKETST